MGFRKKKTTMKMERIIASRANLRRFCSLLKSNCMKIIRNIFPVQTDLDTKMYIL